MTKARAPAGRYALTMNGDVHLYRVWHGRDHTEVFAVAGSGDLGRKLSEQAAAVVLTDINADALSAAQRYGYTTGFCPGCNMPLTTLLETTIGISAVCMKRWMDEDDRADMIAEARKTFQKK